MTLTEVIVQRHKEFAGWRDRFASQGDAESMAYYRDICHLLEDLLRESNEFAALASLFNVATN